MSKIHASILERGSVLLTHGEVWRWKGRQISIKGFDKDKYDVFIVNITQRCIALKGTKQLIDVNTFNTSGDIYRNGEIIGDYRSFNDSTKILIDAVIDADKTNVYMTKYGVILVSDDEITHGFMRFKNFNNRRANFVRDVCESRHISFNIVKHFDDGIMFNTSSISFVNENFKEVEIEIDK